MIANFIKLAFRNLVNQKTFSLLNIIGLSVGMTASILMFLWIQSEWRFDRFHKKLPVLYILWQNQTHSNGEMITFRQMPGGLAEKLKQDFPELRNVTKTSWRQKQVLSVKDKKFKEFGYYVTPPFLEMFSYPLLEGDLTTALNDPTSIVISERLGRKLFGAENPLDKTIEIDNRYPFRITGVLKDVPYESSHQFDFLCSFDAFVNQHGDWVNDWDNNNFPTFVEVHPQTDIQQLDAKLRRFLKARDAKSNGEIFLQPYADMYLHSDFKNGIQEGGRITYVLLFAVIALLTILIACINFMNLATAIADRRAKEIGIRKVAGAGRRSLVVQFLCESTAYSFVSVILCVVLIQLSLPWFNEFTGKQISTDWSDLWYLTLFIFVGIVTGLISGSYPAIYLSSFKPVLALKNALRPAGAMSLRKALVVLQFTFSILMIITTIVIYTQLNFVKGQRLGYQRENVVYVTQTEEAKKKYEIIRRELLDVPGIAGVSRAMSPVVDMWNATMSLKWAGKDPNETLLVSTLPSDYGITETLGMTLVAGRHFSKEFAGDSTAVILNEEAVRQMKLTDPLNQSINWGIDLKIVGVVEDFKFNDLFARPKPVMIMNAPSVTNFVFVRLAGSQNVFDDLKRIETVFARHDPDSPFEYRFLNDEFNDKFRSEVLLGKLSNLFAALAIIISCLGLYGLTTYSVRVRIKEIGIRKVLGASVPGIILLISKDFMMLTGIAFLLAVPIGWYSMDAWLSAFEYRVGLDWWVFVLAGAVAVTIALLTTSVQSIRSALANPVESLRME